MDFLQIISKRHKWKETKLKKTFYNQLEVSFYEFPPAKIFIKRLVPFLFHREAVATLLSQFCILYGTKDSFTKVSLSRNHFFAYRNLFFFYNSD